MKRILLGFAALGLVVGAFLLSKGIGQVVEDKNPWTNLRFNESADTFHFAVVSDRTGGHRARIFSEAVDRLNLMQPAFVVSVGDLIEGYSKDPPKLTEEWKEFQSYVGRLQMPFFYVAGNHDVSNPLGAKEWKERFGRTYYHFVHRDTLFLFLNSDDPSEEKGGGKISPEQVAYVQKALADNPKVNWTMVCMHKPLWRSPKLESNGWLEVEKALQDRQYTVFVGHEHFYQKYVRNGKSYYQLATTGGGSRLRGVAYGEFDHIMWVTMKKDGPVFANIMLDGLLPENLDAPIRDEKGVPTKNRKEVFAARGKVTFKGEPTPKARVVLYSVPLDADKKPDPRKKPSVAAEGRVEADGTFHLSTYGRFDGAPAGEYTVVVTWFQPHIDEVTGKPGPNKLPERYSKVATSDLRVEIKAGQPNVINLDLTP